VLPTRLLFGMVVLVLCAVAGVGAVVIASRGGDDVAIGSTGFAGALRPPGAVAPPFRLLDEDGKAISMDAYRGRPVIMTFIYSHCDDVCPGQVQTIRGALDQLGHDVPVLGVSVDPANDTAASARRFINEQRMTGRMRFVLGSAAALAPVWKGYGIMPQRGTLDHSAYVVLVDGRGDQRIGWPADRLTPEGLAHDLRALGA
jgi:protein SCO1/2